jgi:hypothetical protein
MKTLYRLLVLSLLMIVGSFPAQAAVDFQLAPQTKWEERLAPKKSNRMLTGNRSQVRKNWVGKLKRSIRKAALMPAEKSHRKLSVSGWALIMLGGAVLFFLLGMAFFVPIFLVLVAPIFLGLNWVLSVVGLFSKDSATRRKSFIVLVFSLGIPLIVFTMLST